MEEKEIVEQFREKFTSDDPHNKTMENVPFTIYWKTSEIEQFLLTACRESYERGQENCKHATLEHIQSINRAFSGGKGELEQSLKI